MIDRLTVAYFFQTVFAASPILSAEEKHWTEFAGMLNRGAFIMFLANEVADQLLCRASRNAATITNLICDIENGDIALQQRAETFLIHQRIDCDPTFERRILVFRHFIAIRLRHTAICHTVEPEPVD